uniref:C-type lectin domain-containing protein n=1 Tax=Gasterosteus aculeatus aculeatus TaxID=481459 RepID=G3PPF9_GASAC
TFVLIQLPKSWSAARDYCREHYTDLAKIENDEEQNEVNSAKPSNGIVWIGLYRVPWTWSDKSQSSFRFWDSAQPDMVYDKAICGAMNPSHRFHDGDCSVQLPFYYYVDTLMTWAGAQRYCREEYTDLATFESTDDVSRLPPDSKLYRWIGLSDDPKSWRGTMGNDPNSWRCFVLIQLSKSWSAARDYCRQHYTDLAKIENDEEQNEVNSANPSHGIVWIGLYRVSWTWSDKSQSSFRVWASNEPNNYDNEEFCGAMTSSHQWNDIGCSYLFPFVCHQENYIFSLFS